METMFERALQFAIRAHRGMFRKADGRPYIIHPLEVMSIVSTMTPDEEVLAAALLHDTAEDAGISLDEIEKEFGPRVRELVASETEDKRRGQDPAETWKIRKVESLEHLRNCDDRQMKILWLGDKLSNIRSFYRLYRKEGDRMWRHFHQADTKEQHWYYRTVADYTEELSDTTSWQEYDYLIRQIFEGGER